MRNGCVKELIDVTEQQVFVDFNLLGRLLHYDYLRISLLETAVFCFDLEVTILVAELHSVALVRLLDEGLERNSLRLLLLL